MPLASVYNQNLIMVVFRVNQRRKAYVAEIMESGERHENTDVYAK